MLAKRLTMWDGLEKGCWYIILGRGDGPRVEDAASRRVWQVHVAKSVLDWRVGSGDGDWMAPGFMARG